MTAPRRSRAPMAQAVGARHAGNAIASIAPRLNTRMIPAVTEETHAMSKQPSKRPNKAKSIVAQPLFRSRQERPAKGKGSYRREAFQSKDWEASSVKAA